MKWKMAQIKTILNFILIARLFGRALCYSNGTEQDEVFTWIIQDYITYCPDTVTCDAANTSAQSVFPHDPDVPCCRACSCEAGCGSRCCPDMPDIHIEILEENPLRQCMYAQYRPYNVVSVNGRAIFMINQCPSDFSGNFNIAVGCKADMFDVNVHNIIDMLPVTSTVSGATYKNWMCAVCHGETKSVLAYWEAKFLCDGVPMLIPETIDDIIYYAKNYIKCNILFFPSVSGLSVERCVKTIESCNVTGKWDVYDPLVDIACGSYESIYDSAYKNIHCFLCNHEQGVDIKETCLDPVQPGSRGNAITAVLNFNMFDKSEEEGREKCESDHFFDILKSSCRQKVCNRGLIYRHERCEPLFNVLSGKFVTPVYTLTLAVTPHKVNGTDTLNLHLIGEMLSVATHRAAEMNLSECKIYSYVKLKTNLHELVTNIRMSNISSILFQDIDYVAINLMLMDGLVSVNNITGRIEELSNFLKNISLEGFQISTRNISEQTFSKTGNISTELETYDLDLAGWLHEALSIGYDKDGSANLPLALSAGAVDHECITTYAISADPFCPKLVFGSEDLRVSVFDGTVYLDDMRIRISPSVLSFSENGNYVTLCLDTYTSLLQDYFPDEKSNMSSSPLVILTAVCAALSLISLVVTLAVYIMLPSLRTIPGLNNMGLIISLIAFFVLSFINANVDSASMSNLICKAFGITLHFSLLSSFSWMFVCTFHMARVFANLTQRPVDGKNSSVFIYYVLFTQMVSCSIVVATVSVCHHISDGENIGYSDDPCYVEPSIQLYNVAIPIALVVILNFSMFAFVVITVSRLRDINKNTSHERHNLEIFVKLSTLTGLTWIFGFVYRMTNIEAFAYIFTVLNASQGVFIMVSFALTKRVYTMLRSKWGTSRNIQANSTTTSRYISTNSANTPINSSAKSAKTTKNDSADAANMLRNTSANSANTSRNTSADVTKTNHCNTRL